MTTSMLRKLVAVAALACAGCGTGAPVSSPAIEAEGGASQGRDGANPDVDAQAEINTSPQLPGESAAQAEKSNASALGLCQTVGLENAEQLATNPVLDRVKRTTAGAVTAWSDSRSRDREIWAQVPPETMVALCYFDADVVMAPAPPPSPGEDDRPQYTEHAVAVGENGTVTALWAAVTPHNPSGRSGEAPEDSAMAHQRRGR